MLPDLVLSILELFVRLHPREMLVMQAQGRLYEACDAVHRQFPDLTYNRMFVALTATMQAVLTGEGTTPPTDPVARLLFDGLEQALLDAPLTVGERMAWLAEQMANEARYLIRLERHGTTDQPGGVA